MGEWRRFWLPAEALVELEGRGGLEQRIGGGIVLGIGGCPQRRAAGGRDARWRGRLTEVDEDVAHGRAHLAALDNATVYTFLLPIASLHPQATKKAIAVWCAADRSRAWRAVMLERKTLSLTTCAHPIERNQALAAKLEVRGTPTLIAADGRRAAGAMPAVELSAWLDASVTIDSAAGLPEDRP